MKREVQNIASEKLEILYKLVNKMEEKIKKLENIVENIVRTQSVQMERIVKLISDIKEERNVKGKSEGLKRKMVKYTSECDEYEFY